VDVSLHGAFNLADSIVHSIGEHKLYRFSAYVALQLNDFADGGAAESSKGKTQMQDNIESNQEAIISASVSAHTIIYGIILS
jgi:hypothetical protein